jgi:uncharacterized protein YqgC (DUF456 family)
MDIVWAVAVVVASAICWLLNLVGMPGNWLIVLATALYAQFGPAAGRADIDWQIVVGLLVLALVGELIELGAGFVGAKKAGGSKRGAALALVGSLLGGVLGLVVGVPIPVVGPLVGAVLFGGIGALGGAVVGERWKGRDLEESMRVGEAAFWSRLLGTLGKVVAGGVMVVLVLASVLV